MNKHLKSSFLIILFSALCCLLVTALQFTLFRMGNVSFITGFWHAGISCIPFIVVISILVQKKVLPVYAQRYDEIKNDEVARTAYLNKLGSTPMTSLMLYMLVSVINYPLLFLLYKVGWITLYDGIILYVSIASFAWNILTASVVYIAIDRLNSVLLHELKIDDYPSTIRKARLAIKIASMPCFATIMTALYGFGSAACIFMVYHLTSELPVGLFLYSICMAVVFIALIIFLVLRFAKNQGRLFQSVIEQLDQLSNGDKDLMKRIGIQSIDEVATISGLVNSFTGNIYQSVRVIKHIHSNLTEQGQELGDSVASSTVETAKIGRSIDNIQLQSRDQTASIENTVSAVAQVSRQINELDHRITEQAASITEASASVEEMVGNIGSINNTMSVMTGQFSELTGTLREGSTMQEVVYQKITDIVKKSEDLHVANRVIASIASQTNLLAMNAAIEAAHAGDAGRGFAVVANEIRNLAETSARNSKMISSLLNEVQSGVGAVVDASVESKATFGKVNEQIVATDRMVREINQTLDEQIIGANQILQALTQMNDISTSVQSGSSEMTAGNRTIIQETENLKNQNEAMTDNMATLIAGIGAVNEGMQVVTTAAEGNKDAITHIGKIVDEFKTDRPRQCSDSFQPGI